MKTEVLLRSIGKINDELIADAESEANTKRKPGWAKLGIMAACLALVLCTGIATNAIRSNATAGTFTMDVNPSVEYTIAKSGAVKSIRSLNSDAEAALSGIVPGRQSVEAALTRTVAAYEACGYMENGEATVLISFDSRLDANAELKASLSAEIQQTLEQTDAVGTLVFHSELTENAEAAKIAEEFHVSLGRADWILAAADKTGLPTDEVARMSLDELLKFQEASGIASVSVDFRCGGLFLLFLQNDAQHRINAVCPLCFRIGKNEPVVRRFDAAAHKGFLGKADFILASGIIQSDFLRFGKSDKFPGVNNAVALCVDLVEILICPGVEL